MIAKICLGGVFGSWGGNGASPHNKFICLAVVVRYGKAER